MVIVSDIGFLQWRRRGGRITHSRIRFEWPKIARTHEEAPMRAERFDFPNARGQTLAAVLHRPAGARAAFALFAHCFPCGKDTLAARRIAEALAERGIAVLRFDFTGLGASEGEFANTHFSSNVADLVAAADHLRRTARAPALMIGHSLG